MPPNLGGEPLAGLTEQLLESAPDAVVIVGSDGSIIFANAQAVRLFGYGRSELVGGHVDQLIPERAKGIHPSHRAAYFAHPTTRPMGAGLELKARRKDGTEFPVDIALSSLETSSGIIVSAAVRDISDLIEADRERQRLESQLRRSRMETIGQLAGGIAHDFNNLLAGIMSYARLVEEGVRDRSGDGVVLEDVAQIVRATERAASLTRQLLVFGRRDVVRRELLDLNTVVADMEKLLRRTIGEPIDLRAKLAPVRAVEMDLGHVEQVLMNLAVNGRDAMPDGGTLTIETHEVVLDEETVYTENILPGEYLRLSVSDTGTGMTPEVAAHAFEPFFTTKPQGRGTGLGLAIVYGIATQAAGSATIYSEPGVGTTIRVYLPLVEDAARAPRLPTAQAVARSAGETILLVEDEDLVREPAARFLANHGYNVLSAASAEEALDLSRRRPGDIDLLLTDVVLPSMSGKDLAAEFVRSRPETRVVYMSGYSQDVIASQGVIQPGVVLIEKPFTVQGLLATVRDVLEA